MNHWKKNKASRDNFFIHINNKENHRHHKLLKRIKIKVIDHPIEKALEYYYKVNPNASMDTPYSNNFLLRVTLNYIRHNYSNYERVIQQMGSSLYNQIELKKYVNQAIIEKYKFKQFGVV